VRFAKIRAVLKKSGWEATLHLPSGRRRRRNRRGETEQLTQAP
jgi:hypothetical protein